MRTYSPLQYALNLLKLRDRTESEIKKKMKGKGFSEPEITETVAFLKDKKFIDDDRFVEGYLRNFKSTNIDGKRKIISKLYNLGIDKELISHYQSKITPESEQDKAIILASKWLQKNQNKEKKYERLGRFLAAKGFEINIVRTTLEKTLINKEENYLLEN